MAFGVGVQAPQSNRWEDWVARFPLTAAVARCVGKSNIKPQAPDIEQRDALTLMAADIPTDDVPIMANPPHIDPGSDTRLTPHKIIERFSDLATMWLRRELVLYQAGSPTSTACDLSCRSERTARMSQRGLQAFVESRVGLRPHIFWQSNGECDPMPITADEAAVKNALDDLIKAMLAADKARLEAGAADQLSFVHANGHTQNKAEFVEVIASKKAIYKSITFVEQPTVTVLGNTAIVRYTTAVEVGSISLRLVVLQVWTKDGGVWKLQAHQATKL